MSMSNTYSNVVKTGGLQRQGDKSEAVVANYCEPLTTQYLEFSGFCNHVSINNGLSIAHSFGALNSRLPVKQFPMKAK